MEPSLLIAIGVAALVGAALAWLVARRLAEAERQRALSEAEVRFAARESALREQIARHEADAARDARDGNLTTLLAPIRETLTRYDTVLARMGQAQAQTAGQIGERLDAVALAGESLRRETQQLAQALRAPSVRGQWGELQLRRVCELAGMLAYCDFEPQVTMRGDGGTLRPDLIVRLPGERSIVVDAKAPLTGYLEAMAATDERTRAERLREHAAQVRAHVQKLSAKAYQKQFDGAPDFVVLFLPGEAFFAAALDADPSLLEAALGDRVLLATPTTLIALLKAAAYGWREARAAEDAAAITALGRELHERLNTFATQLAQVGKGIATAAQAYDRAVGSLDRRVLVSARKLAEMSGGDVVDVSPLHLGVGDALDADGASS